MSKGGACTRKTLRNASRTHAALRASSATIRSHQLRIMSFMTRASGGLGEVGLLRCRLRLIDRALALRRRQRHPHRHLGHARRNDDVAGENATVELVKILYAHQRPGVAGGDLVE